MAEPEAKAPVVETARAQEAVPRKKLFVCKVEDCGMQFADQAQYKEHNTSHGEKTVG